MSTQLGTITRILRLVKGGTAILAALVFYLAGTLVSQRAVRADEIAKKDTRQSFYMTPLAYDGSQALNACAAGYHMASMWEILDPSNLRYDTTLGLTREDSGSGPPQVLSGWVRTGGISRGIAMEGWGNCRAWTSNDSVDEGTAVGLPLDWALQSDSRPIEPWSASHSACNSQVRVWCVLD